jgi:putative ABC transport system ATP-binding protein
MVFPAVAMRGLDLSLGRGAARVHILRDVALTIGKGEAVGIIGASGSGKSTLLMIMAGLERPNKGEVEIDGVRLGGLNEDALARFRGQRIGIVFQSFHLIPTMTALENVAAPLELSGAVVGRRAAARGAGPRALPPPLVADRGRADRQSR